MTSLHRALPCVLLALALPVVPATARPAVADPRRLASILAGAAQAGASPAVLAGLRTRTTARLAPGDGEEHSAYLDEIGDLDEDGRPDLIDVREHGVPVAGADGSTSYEWTTKVDARRGWDGALLWSRTFGANEYVVPLPGRVGTLARAGVLFAVYGGASRDADAEVAGGAAYADTLTLRGIDGRTGNQQFSTTVAGGGGWAYALPAYIGGTDAYPVLYGRANLAGNAADDLLVGLVAVQDSEAGMVRRLHLVAVSGADGAVSDTGVTAVREDGFVSARTLPDVTGDKLAEVMTNTAGWDGPAADLAAYRSGGGSLLWTTAIPTEDGVWTTPVGDLTADGAADLAAMSGVYGVHGGEIATTVLDTKTGKKLWTKTGRPLALGDANRDHRAEVALLRDGGGNKARVEAEAFDHLGRRRWIAARSLTGSSSGWWIDSAGDVNADGVVDVGYSLASGSGRSARSEEGWIDGRTGRAHRDPRTKLRTLYAAIDGRGTDNLIRTLSRDQLTVTAYTGDTGALLWSSRVRLPVDVTFVVQSFALAASNTRCADALLTVVGDEPKIVTVAFRSDGTPIWMLTRDGGPGRPELDRPPVLARTSRNPCR